MKIRSLTVPALLCTALFLGACHSDQKKAEPTKTAASMGIMNKKCPVSGETLGEDGWDKVTTTDYNGKKIGFCCPNCAGKFKNMSDADKAAKVANAN